MKTIKLSRYPWLSLTLVVLSYALWGWYISYYAPIWLASGWLVAVLIAVMTIWSGRSIGRLMRLGPRGVLTMLILSMVVTTAIASSALFSTVTVLTLAQVLARFELRTLGVRRIMTLAVLMLSTSIGLVLGWLIGKLLVPSYPFWLGLLTS